MSTNLPPTIAANIEQFTGRTWLLPKVLDWYKGNQERIFLLTGGPGTGKSMIMAWLAGHGPVPEDAMARAQLAQIRTQVKATHFCQATSRNITPQAFAETVAQQLTRAVPGFDEALAATLAERVQFSVVQETGTVEAGGSVTGISIGHIDLGTLGDEQSFDRAFTRPLKKLYENGHDQPLLLLVDALDEALTYGGVTLVQLLSRLGDLPTPVRILTTTRPDPRVTKHYRRSPALDLIVDAPADVDDVEVYARQRLREAEDLNESQQDQLAARISQAAQGVFLYAAMILDDLLPHLPEISDLEEYPLPEGLTGLYHAFLNRELGEDEDRWFQDYEPLLGLIAVAQEPGLTRRQIERISGKDVLQTLRVCKQYLSGELPDGPFRPFHQSFLDFLLEDENNLHYRIDGDRMHRQIVASYRGEARSWDELDWNQVDDYGLRHMAHHISAVSDQTAYYGEMQSLLNRSYMWAKFRRTGSLGAFADDVSLAQEMARQRLPPDHVQVAWTSLLYGTLVSLSTDVPLGLLDLLAQLGEADAALEHAALIQNGARRCEACLAIVDALPAAVSEERRLAALDQAFESAEMIGHEQIKAVALAGLALRLAQLGQIERARSVIDNALLLVGAIEDDWDKAGALTGLARALRQPAIEEGTEDTRDGTTAQYVRQALVEALEETALSLAEVGFYDQALAITDDMEGRGFESEKQNALHQVVETLLRAGHLDQASQVAERLGVSWRGNHAFLDIAEALMRAGKRKQARSAIDRALTVTEQLEEPDWQFRGLIRIAEALVDLGDIDQAHEVLAKASAAMSEMRDQRRNRRQLDIDYAIVKQGKRKEARSVVNQALAETDIPMHTGEDLGLVFLLAQGLVQAEGRDQARNMVDRLLAATDHLGHGSARVWTLVDMAKVLVQVGKIDWARSILAQASALVEQVGGAHKFYMLVEIAQTLVKAGELEHARTVVAQALAPMEERGDLPKTVETLVHVAKVFEQMGAADQAREFLDQALGLMEQFETRDLDWTWLQIDTARTLVKCGDHAQASEVFDRVLEEMAQIGALSERVERLVHLGRVLVDKGSEDGDKAVIAWAQMFLGQAITAGEQTTFSGPAISLTEIAQVLARMEKNDLEAGILDQALCATKLLDDSPESAWALVEMAKVLLQVKEADQARMLLGQASILMERFEPRDRTRLQIEITRILVRVGESEQARAMVYRAVAATGWVSPRAIKDQHLQLQAQVLVQVGEYDRALALAEQIRDPASRAQIMKQVALALAQADHSEWADSIFDQALAAARGIEASANQATALAHIAQAMAWAEDRSRASTVFSQALAAARVIQDPEQRKSVLNNVICSLTQVGEYEQALETERIEKADQIEKALRRGMSVDTSLLTESKTMGSWSSVAQSAQQQVYLGRAMRELPRRRKPADLLKVLFGRAKDEWTTGLELHHYIQAVMSARSIGPAAQRAEALKGVAMALVQVGELGHARSAFSQALEAAMQIQDERWRAWAIGGVAGRMVRAGCDDLISSTVVEWLGTVDGVQVLGMVAHALTKAGKSERAKTFLEAALPTVEQIGLVNDKAGALSLIAQEFAQIGELEQVRNLFNEALTVTRRMKDTKAKAMVLGDMAQAMASAGLTHEALEAVMLALDAARMRGRNLVINVLLQWVGWLARDGGEAALQMIHAIEETDGWWSAPTTP